MPLPNEPTHIHKAFHTPRHPDPLRSHSRPANILALDDNNIINNSIPPDSFGLDNSLHHPSRRRSLQSFRSSRDEEDVVLPPLPSPTRQAGFVGSAQTGFGDAAFDYYPVIPVRPPLRPSKWSYDSDGSWMGKHRSVTVTVEEDVPSSGRMDWRDLTAVGCLCLLNFTCDLSASSLSTALPYIATELQLSPVEALWIPGSYLLASALSQPLSMRLSSALGTKALLLVGLLLFTIGNIVSGLANDGTSLLLGRSIEGFGAGAITVLAQLISSQLCRETNFVKRFGPSGLRLFWLGIALGPITGIAIARNTNWRDIFWIQLQPSIIAIVALPLLLRLPYFETGVGMRRLLKVDFLGWLFLSASVAPVMIAISWAGTKYPWCSWHTLVPLIVGIVSLAGWAMYNKYRMEPIIPISIFHSWRAIVSCFGAIVLGCLVMGIIYFVPTYSQINGMSSALAALSLTVSLTASSLITNLFTDQLSHQWTTPIAWATLALTTALMLLPSHPTTPAFFIPMGLACGSLLTNLAQAIQTAASNDDETIHAAPLYLFFITLGQGIGVIVSPSAEFWVVACVLAGLCFLFSLWFVRGGRR